jgi:hypothetical protein
MAGAAGSVAAACGRRVTVMGSGALAYITSIGLQGARALIACRIAIMPRGL